MDLCPNATANSWLVMHKLNIKEGTQLIKQALRNFRSEFEVQIKKKIQKLLDISFIKPM